MSSYKRRTITAALVGLSIALGSFASGLQSAHAAGLPKASLRSAGLSPAPQTVGHPRGIVPRRNETGPQPRFSIGAAGGNPQCPACIPPLVFHPWSTLAPTPVAGGFEGTPGHITITAFYWGPATSFTPTYKSIINGYIANVAIDSQKATNVFSVGTQYYQQPPNSPLQHIQYVVLAGTPIDDPTPYPTPTARSCTADTGSTACISDGDLTSYLVPRLQALSQPIDDSHLYMVLFPQSVETCFGPGTSTTQVCSTSLTTPGYCAYHGAVTVNSATNSYLLYGNQPFPDMIHCIGREGPQAPNGDATADAQISLLSHEANETITDWALAWYDRSTAGYENGDLCAYVYGHSLGGTSVVGVGGNFYNQVINGARYYTQDEFSNEDFALSRGDNESNNFANPVFGCVQQDELPIAAFSVPPTVGIGTSTAFNGSTSADPDNSAALAYSWSWGDGTGNSAGATPSHIFASTSTVQVTLTVTDVDGWSGSVTHAVAPTFSRTVGLTSAPAGAPGVRTAIPAPANSISLTPRVASIQPAAQTMSGAAAAPSAQSQIPVKPTAGTQPPQPTLGGVGSAAQTKSVSPRSAKLDQHQAASGDRKVEWPELVLLAVVVAVKRAFSFL